jgi:hypothetical protein
MSKKITLLFLILGCTAGFLSKYFEGFLFLFFSAISYILPASLFYFLSRLKNKKEILIDCLITFLLVWLLVWIVIYNFR